VYWSNIPVQVLSTGRVIQQGPAPPEHCDQQARTYRQLQIAIHYRDGKGMYVSAPPTSPNLAFVFIHKACELQMKGH
jgi:hypothetical protein